MFKSKTENILGIRTVIPEENQLIETTPNTRSEIRWSAFEKMGEINKHFFIVFNGNQGNIIPRRAFNELSEKSAYCDLVPVKFNNP